jgi:OOP family OmpA-OmpF porin
VDNRGCWVLRNVRFDVDKSDIKPEFFPFLDEVVTVLRSNPGLKIVIEGHTDSDGTDEYNQKLSQRRAQAVMDYFVSKGLEPARLTAIGYGETKPIASNDTDEGKAENRRIELSVVK